MSVDQLVLLAHAGASAEVLVERWRQDGARLKLSLADFFALRAKGVSEASLEALFEAQEVARQTDFNDQLARQLAEFSAQLAVERNRIPQCPAAPFYYGQPVPYGGWGSASGWNGGLFWGW